MGKIFLCSDWHFCHIQPFLYEPRGCQSPQEMNEKIIRNHNAIVSYDDDVYCLGDLVMNDTEAGIRCIKRLNGKIHIITGNHDTLKKIEQYKTCRNIVEICDGKWLKINGQMIYLSHYPCLTSNMDEDSKPFNRRIVNFCGHCHTTDKFLDIDKGLIYHVEMDAHDCTPIDAEVALKEVKDYVEKREK